VFLVLAALVVLSILCLPHFRCFFAPLLPLDPLVLQVLVPARAAAVVDGVGFLAVAVDFITTAVLAAQTAAVLAASLV